MFRKEIARLTVNLADNRAYSVYTSNQTDRPFTEQKSNKSRIIASRETTLALSGVEVADDDSVNMEGIAEGLKKTTNVAMFNDKVSDLLGRNALELVKN